MRTFARTTVFALATFGLCSQVQPLINLRGFPSRAVQSATVTLEAGLRAVLTPTARPRAAAPASRSAALGYKPGTATYPRAQAVTR
jgi:hypothetical protein